MYQLNDEQSAVLARAREAIEGTIGPQAADVDAEGRFPSESIAALGSAGLLGLNVPTELGGLGQGPRTACAVLDEIAQRCPSTAMIYKMHLCGIAVCAQAADRMADRLRAAAAGEHLSTLAFSERGSRSHFWAPVSKAQPNGSGVVLSAEKSWVTSAGHAQGYVMSAGWAEAQAPVESTIYLVEQGDPGLSVAGSWTALGMRGNASSPMTLADVPLGADRELSEPGKGLDVMLGVVLPIFSLGSAAISVGICEAAVGATQSHLTAQRFEHLGSKLADLPTLRANLARMRIATDKARAHVAATLGAIEGGSEAAQLMVLEVKAQAAETALEVTDIGMRSCGGAAFSKHLGLERYFRDARAAAVMAPTSDQAYDIIGRALCGMELLA